MSRPTLAVLGAGAWGTALANMAASQHEKVWVWAHEPWLAEALRADRENKALLPGVPLAACIEPTDDLDCVREADHVLMVTPAQVVRSVCEQLKGRIRPDSAVVSCAKGIERGTGLYMREVLAEVLPEQPGAALSGPSFAHDVGRGLPTAVTLAADRIELAEVLCARLAAPHFRLYRSDDLIGVEIGGAVKNVLAIACGVALGHGLGASAHAALLARGFAEMRRFAMAQGAKMETLMGLSGLGDLALTCSSPQSRNYSLGFAIGQGEKPEVAGHGALTEGAWTAPVLTQKARSLGVEMPIAEAVQAILDNRSGVAEAIGALMGRPFKAEGF
jgi:glycerol-3-phosphate dehydrogenase (NAD(P)+)